MKKIVFIDMDGVIADFGKELEKLTTENIVSSEFLIQPDLIEGIFKKLSPIEGAIDSIHEIHNSGFYDLFIATSAPWSNPRSFTDKRLWIENHFGDLFKKKMFITHRKDMLIGDFLIDDRLANGAENFNGKLLRFGWDYEKKKWNEYRDWNAILDLLI
jgi:5'(3')-deoxyribonucleotidase